MCTCLQYRIPDNLPWLRNRDQACHAELSELFWQDAAPGGGTLLPAWNPRGGSDSPSARYPHQGLPLSLTSVSPFRFSLCRWFPAPPVHGGPRPGSSLLFTAAISD